MKVLYINYIDTKLGLSGAEVRPLKILNAFSDAGYEVISLTGEQTLSQRKIDIKKFWNVVEGIESDSKTICYIESPTYPIWHHEDRKLIRKIHKKGIPIGYFYRDFYRKFPDQFPRRKGFIGRLKEFALDFLQWRTDKTLECCDIVYFPSDEASKLFHFKTMRSLPPAGTNNIINHKQKDNTGIYVGGVAEYYDVDLLLNTYQSLYNEDNSFHLILVCRKEEWNEFNHPFKNAEWLEVHHTSKEGLIPLYNRASLAFVCPNKSFPYNSFAVSVKTFEYISCGLPVVGINCNALASIIKEYNLGLVSEPDVVSFANAIKKITIDDDTYNGYCENIKQALLNNHLWSHRVRQVVEDLSLFYEGNH